MAPVGGMTTGGFELLTFELKSIASGSCFLEQPCWAYSVIVISVRESIDISVATVFAFTYHDFPFIWIKLAKCGPIQIKSLFSSC